MAFLVVQPPNGTAAGFVNGPGPGAGTSTDNAVARWDGTTGSDIQNSGVIIDDSNNVTGVASLTVTTLVATTTVTTGDNIIILNDDEAGVPSQNAGIEIERGSSTNATLLWDESTDRWVAGLVGSPVNLLIMTDLAGMDNAAYTDVITLTDAATIAVDTSLANSYKVTLGGNRTLGAPTNLVDGMKFDIVITQDGTGSRTLAYNAVWKFPLGIVPTLSTAAGAVDILSCRVHGSIILSILNTGFA